MYCTETPAAAEEGWEYFHNQLTAAQHHYFEWNNPDFEGIHGYEEYLKRQTADVGVADASFAARRETQPIGTPDEIIDKIKTLQWAISLEMLVIHMFYGGMPRAKDMVKNKFPFSREFGNDIGKLGSHDTLPVLIDVESHHSVTIIALPLTDRCIIEGHNTRNSIRTKMYHRHIPCNRQEVV